MKYENEVVWKSEDNSIIISIDEDDKLMISCPELLPTEFTMSPNVAIDIFSSWKDAYFKRRNERFIHAIKRLDERIVNNSKEIVGAINDLDQRIGKVEKK